MLCCTQIFFVNLSFSILHVFYAQTKKSQDIILTSAYARNHYSLISPAFRGQKICHSHNGPLKPCIPTSSKGCYNNACLLLDFTLCILKAICTDKRNAFRADGHSEERSAMAYSSPKKRRLLLISIAAI